MPSCDFLAKLRLCTWSGSRTDRTHNEHSVLVLFSVSKQLLSHVIDLHACTKNEVKTMKTKDSAQQSPSFAKICSSVDCSTRAAQKFPFWQQKKKKKCSLPPTFKRGGRSRKASRSFQSVAGGGGPVLKRGEAPRLNVCAENTAVFSKHLSNSSFQSTCPTRISSNKTLVRVREWSCCAHHKSWCYHNDSCSDLGGSCCDHTPSLFSSFCKSKKKKDGPFCNCHDSCYDHHDSCHDHHDSYFYLDKKKKKNHRDFYALNQNHVISKNLQPNFAAMKRRWRRDRHRVACSRGSISRDMIPDGSFFFFCPGSVIRVSPDLSNLDHVLSSALVRISLILTMRWPCIDHALTMH